MPYKSLSKASKETIKRTAIAARAKKLESGEIKRCISSVKISGRIKRMSNNFNRIVLESLIYGRGK